jgi:acyl dehydratase
MKTFKNLSELKTYTGYEIGVTPYLKITQEMINDFARATQDYQWIHVDVEKARKYSPFKSTVAHGFLTLSLAPRFMAELFAVSAAKMSLNYGANKVRFTSAVPVNCHMRMRGTILAVDEVQNGAKILMECVFEIEGLQKPACIAELISIIYE